jgi:hypothetical protein
MSRWDLPESVQSFYEIFLRPRRVRHAELEADAAGGVRGDD